MARVRSGRVPTVNTGGYHIDIEIPSDSEITDRSRVSRLVSALLTSAAILLVPAMFGSIWGSMIGPTASTIGFFLGLGVGVLVLSRFANRMFVYNAEWTGYVTQDPFTKKMVSYGPALSLSHWWEQRSRSNSIPLEVITKTIKIPVSTQTAQVTVDVVFQYMVDLPYVKNFVGVDDETTIEEGLASFIESFVTEKFSAMTAESARTSIKDANRELAREFMGLTQNGMSPVAFEHEYGIKTVSIVIKGISLSAAAQKTRDAVDEAATLHNVAARLLGVEPDELKRMVKAKEIGKEEMRDLLDKAMATSENATMDIKVTRNTIDLPQVPQLLDAVFKYLDQRGGAK